MKLLTCAMATAAVLLTGCASAPGSTTTATAATPAATQTAALSMPDGPGRDWTKVDTNGDNAVSPEEMEKWLKANPGPLAPQR